MPRYASNKGKKRCPICRGFFDKRGIDTHIKFCERNHPMRATAVAKRKPVAKPKAKPKERFAVFGPIRDLESYAIVGSLKEAQGLASELLEMGTEAEDVAVLKVVGEYLVTKVEVAELTQKK